MILINLLPPELRKRGSGVNPVVISAVCGGLAALVLLGFWGYLHYVRIPKSNSELERLTLEREDKVKKSEAIAAMKTEIAKVKSQGDKVNELLAQKVYWARTIDDFANMLSTKWNHANFDARCLDFTVSPRSEGQIGPAAAKQTGVQYSVKVKFKITGTREDEVGDYIKAFTSTIRESDFWKRGFVGSPDAFYRTDTRSWNETIKRVIFEFPLEWTREKQFPTKAKGK